MKKEKFFEFNIRLDNSICDIVRLKDHREVFTIDGIRNKTKKNPSEYKDLYGVTYCHINSSADWNERRIWTLFDPMTPRLTIGKHELKVSEYDIYPKNLERLLSVSSYRNSMCVVFLKNLECVVPNSIKRDKLINPGNSYCLIRSINDLKLDSEERVAFSQYDLSKCKSSKQFVPSESNLGKVVKINLNQPKPIQVMFPNGTVRDFIAEELTFFKKDPK